MNSGEVTSAQLDNVNKLSGQVSKLQDWALKHADSTDKDVMSQVAVVKELSRKCDDLQSHALENLGNAVDDKRLGDVTPQEKSLAGKIAGNDEMRDAGKSWLGKAFTTIGLIRLACKTAGVLLNNGKAVVDSLSERSLRNKEDENVIAEMRFILSNGDDSDSKFNDTKFSVRYDLKDREWHATCLDNRKMKFPEDEVVKKALSTPEGKKFREFCLKCWKSLFRPADKKNSIIPFILSNFRSIMPNPSKDQ